MEELRSKSEMHQARTLARPIAAERQPSSPVRPVQEEANQARQRCESLAREACSKFYDLPVNAESCKQAQACQVQKQQLVAMELDAKTFALLSSCVY